MAFSLQCSGVQEKGEKAWRKWGGERVAGGSVFWVANGWRVFRWARFLRAVRRAVWLVWVVQEEGEIGGGDEREK